MSAAVDSDSDQAATPPGLHVLHVADRDVFARLGRMLRQLFLGLEECGIRVSLLTDDVRASEQCAPVTLRALTVPQLSGWRAWRTGARIAAGLSEIPKLVHLWGTARLRPVSRWAEQMHIPLLVHCLSTWDVDAITRRGVRGNQYVAGACTRFCRLLADGPPVSHYPVQQFAPALLLPDLEDQPPRSPRTLGVIWAGRLDDAAGLRTLLDAVARLHAGQPDLQVALIGRPSDEHQARTAIRSRHIEDRVSLIGDAGLWDDAMQGGDVCVVPARETDLSLAPLLAMALQKVVIASSDQLAEWFIDGRTVWAFARGSSTELAGVLARVHSQPAAAAELGQRARQYVAEHHSISRAAANLAGSYTATAFPQTTVQFRAWDRALDRPA